MNIKPDIRIIVVDDMVTMRRILINMLTELGLENVTQASDGEIAWKLIQQESQYKKPIEFIISDWNMPNMTGIELFKKVRTHDTIKDVPFLMVTAENENEKILQAVEAGVTNLIVKPFTIDILKTKLTQIFGK